MVTLNSGSSTTPCPNCGEPMGLVSWVGEKPVCGRCAGVTTTDVPDLGSGLTFEAEEQQECMHEALERSLPPNQRGGPHMLVCNCPKCRIIC